MPNPFAETMHEDVLKCHDTKDDFGPAYIVINHFKLKQFVFQIFRRDRCDGHIIAQLYVLELRRNDRKSSNSPSPKLTIK